MNRFSNTEQISQAGAAGDAQIRLTDDERQPCEVWTRVMGYHRPVASFNIGKQGEHNERRFFVQPG
jgi:anaerobic ribonucleoside-triphosphate reductase